MQAVARIGIEKKSFDVGDILATATKEKTSSKSKVPVLTVSGEVKTLVSEIRNLKEEIEGLESISELKEAQLINDITPDREVLCQQEGYVSSIKVPDTNGYSITLSWKEAYSKIPAGSAPIIQKVIGEDRYKTFFNTQYEIKVKDTSESALRELINLVGDKLFARFFEVETWIKPSPRYTQEFFTVFESEEREALKDIVKQYKPALKTK